MQLTLDKFGRIVIPKAIRDDLDLQPGDVLEVEEGAQSIVLKPATSSGALKMKGNVLVHTGRAVGDIESAVARSREERMKKIMRGL